ncbi:hypothetical protein [Streptomyces sp. NPDC052036]
MHAAWVSFAATGDPGWPACREPDPTVRHFGTSPGLVHDPRRDLRTPWEGLR